MVDGAGDGGGVHECVGPTSSSRADGCAPSSDPTSCISLFKKTIVVTCPADISRPMLLCHNNDGPGLPITTVQPQ
jgi:hypothetical protein